MFFDNSFTYFYKIRESSFEFPFVYLHSSVTTTFIQSLYYWSCWNQQHSQINSQNIKLDESVSLLVVEKLSHSRFKWDREPKVLYNWNHYQKAALDSSKWGICREALFPSFIRIRAYDWDWKHFKNIYKAM